MPTYQMTAPDGKTYRIDGPAGATDDQVRAEIIKQNPHLGESSAAPATATMQLETTPYQRQSLTERIMNLPVRAAEWMYEHPKEVAATGIETGTQIAGGLAGGIVGATTAPVTGPVGAFTGAVGGGTAGYTFGRQLTGKLGLREEEPVLTSAGTGLLYEAGGQLLGKGVGKVVEKVAGKGAVKAPTVAELKQESNALREKMYSTNQQYNPNQLKVEIQQGLETSQPRFPVTGSTEATGTQNALKVLDTIISEHNQGTRITKIDELDNLRRELSSVASKGGNDGAYALKAIQKLDEFVDKVGGDAAKAWKEARALETKQFKSKEIQDIVTKAELSPQATSSEIRKQFGKIVADKNEMKFYTPEQQTVIKQIADGTATEKTFELIGKMAPKSVTWSRILSLTGIGGGAAAVGGLPGVLAVGAGLSTGVASRKAANALARSRVNMLDELIRGGQMPQTIQLPQTTQRLFPAGVNVLANQLQGQQ